ncbi:ricin-type beta-trefoil lectin domain protein [Kutzneria sp. NPDC051319]|uniref:RICIN domain-containing protein n=1 Tax=Kutzneria sp. NPDC051319 TaxID=3155047 RepID=UPI00343C946D
MEPFDDQPRHRGRQRLDAAVVWTATAGALVCSVVIFLATNWPSPEPVAVPAPSSEWRFPVTPSSTVDTDTPGSPFDVVAPPQAMPTVSSPPRVGTSAITTANPPQPRPQPGNTTTAPRPAGTQVRAAGKCLDVPNSTTPGTQLQIWSCSGRPNQAWARTPSGQLTVTLNGVTQCVDAYQHGTTPGTPVTVWPCNGRANQQWLVGPDGTITGVQSGLCLDVTGGSTADGAQVELWTCNGRTNQRWTLG